MKLIEIKNLCRHFEIEGVITKALNGVSFSINKGEFVAIMGPSGSGKSTLLHILGFLDRHTSGEFIFDGKSSTTFDDLELAKLRNKSVGFVFQSFNLLSKSNVLDNVKLPLMYSDVPEEKWDEIAKKCIEDVGLSHRTNYKITRLSGGEKQRVAIARALVNNPKIIFADEPTGNLDSKSGQKVMQVLEELNIKKDHTIILITHETETASHAERIIKLKDGLLVSDKKVEKRRSSKDFKK